MEFEGFPKIPRITNEKMVVTEKIDGTNAQICITEDGQFLTGSRNRWISPDDDNFGFSRWAHANVDELMKLGPGRHFGEWYGSGIQRGYGLSEKRFALFNTARWGDHNPNTPKCCEVVHKIYEGELSFDMLNSIKTHMQACGSYQVPGYDNPEGVVLYLPQMRTLYKFPWSK